MKVLGRWFWPSARRLAWIPLLLGAAPIASLLLYFLGTTSLSQGTRWILLPALIFLALFVIWRNSAGDRALTRRIGAGLWAGALATLAYDLVRVPLSDSGVPVFKAISYFGTSMLAAPHPSLSSEIVGWSYHLSNGMGFGLMYAIAIATPRLWTAITWGLVLEGIMLLTPYAEVFGYRASSTWLATTVGAHLIYGAAMWAALVVWRQLEERHNRRLVRVALLTVAIVGIAAIGARSFERHASTIPPSPPPYLGPHLYTTWSVPEPDRVATLWLLQRFVDPAARFHFVEPFSQVKLGIPIDIPEAQVRRSSSRSATEIFLEERGLEADPKLRALGEMTHLFEIARWRLPAHPMAHDLGLRLIEAVGECGPRNAGRCFSRGLSFLDDWYARAAERSTASF